MSKIALARRNFKAVNKFYNPAKLNINDNMLSMSIESAELGTFSIHTETRLVQASARFKKILGFSEEEGILYETLIHRIEPEHRIIFINAIEANIKSGIMCDLEIPFYGVNRVSQHWVRLTGNLSYNHENKPAYFTGVLKDITIQKQDELRKNDFIAMVSHDLKSPLTSIQAYMQLISLKIQGEENAIVDGYLNKVNVSIKKMNRMINGFLTVAGSEHGQIQLDLEHFELNTLIIEIIEEFVFIYPEIDIVYEAVPALLLYADRDKVGQVLSNFISNAIKYSEAKSPLNIILKDIKGMAQVCVKDKGIGIKLNDQTKIFSRYYRVKRAETTFISGFGLGLHLSYEIIKRHGGKVWVRSIINKGSSFYFSLPLKEN